MSFAVCIGRTWIITCILNRPCHTIQQTKLQFYVLRTMTNVNQAPLPRLSKRRWYVLRLLSGAISSTWLYLFLWPCGKGRQSLCIFRGRVQGKDSPKRYKRSKRMWTDDIKDRFSDGVCAANQFPNRTESCCVVVSGLWPSAMRMDLDGLRMDSVRQSSVSLCLCSVAEVYCDHPRGDAGWPHRRLNTNTFRATILCCVRSSSMEPIAIRHQESAVAGVFQTQTEDSLL